MTDITYQDIEQALLEALGPDAGPEDALTTRELAKIKGLGSRDKVRELLRTLIEQGRVECITVTRFGIDGSPSKIPAYRLRGTT